MTKLLATLALLLTTLALAPPAAAHEGEGAIDVIRSEPAGGLALRYELKVSFVADGHGAPDATVTATVVDPAGARTPVPFTKVREDGTYEGTVTVPAPGTWTVRFTALRPTATLERPEEIAAPATTADTAATTTDRPNAANASEASRGRARSEGKNPLPLYLAGGIVAAGVGAALVLARKPPTDAT